MIWIQLVIFILPLLLKLLGFMKAHPDGTTISARERRQLEKFVTACQQIVDEGKRLGIAPEAQDV